VSAAGRGGDVGASTPDEQEAAFIASITASATHEIRNVLAIVRESAGLIEDLVRSAGEHVPDRSRLLKSTERIASQVARGAEIVTSLNRFAHSLDRTRDTLDLGQEVQQAAFLCQRFARQRNHAIVVRPGDQDLTVQVHPLRLHMALFAAMDWCMERLPEPGTVTVRAVRRGPNAAVEVGGEVAGTPLSSTAAPAAPPARLTELVKDLGVAIEVGEAACRFRLVFSRTGAA
jgi:C4-dicarboxylate-specific signal transduction histidine kinase